VRCVLVAVAVVVAALVLPSAALAHVGKSAPVATNFDAQIGGLKPASGAVEAKVVDGDRELWLHIRATTTVLIPGAEDEPLLRFDHAGVFAVNLRSLTAQSDRIDRFDLRPDPNPKARPLWQRLSSGHSYLWHEHRLHALEPLARGDRATAVIGRWSVPLVIDGHHHALEGKLVYHPPGSAWPWILLACALAATSSGALAVSSFAARRTAVLAALVGMLLVWMVRIGRELYGRPSVGVTGYVEIALTSLVGVVLLWALLHRDEEVRVFTAFLVSFGCLYQGLTMLPVLTHAVALTRCRRRLRTLVSRRSSVSAAACSRFTLREQFADAVKLATEKEAEPPGHARNHSADRGRHETLNVGRGNSGAAARRSRPRARAHRGCAEGAAAGHPPRARRCGRDGRDRRSSAAAPDAATHPRHEAAPRQHRASR
jgi:hypothetical protein